MVPCNLKVSRCDQVVQAEPKKVIPASPTQSCDGATVMEAEAKEAKPDIATRPSSRRKHVNVCMAYCND